MVVDKSIPDDVKFKVFYDGTLNMLVIDKMMKIGMIFDQTSEVTDAIKADCFTTENKRVFTDFTHINGALYMIVKTWQKVIF